MGIAPVVKWWDSDSEDISSTEINVGNPISWGTVDAGSADNEPIKAASAHFPIWVTNDRDGGAGSATMTNVAITVKNASGGNTGEIIAGTTGYAYPWVKVKSVGASGCTADTQLSYSRAGGTTTVSVGDIPSAAGRQLYALMDVPPNATPGDIDFLLRASFQYV